MAGKSMDSTGSLEIGTGLVSAKWKIGSREVELSGQSSNGLNIKVLDKKIVINLLNQKEKIAYINFDKKRWWVWFDGHTYCLKRVPSQWAQGIHLSAENVIRSPMTGTIMSIEFQEGDFVREGDLVLKMEAMKMEYALSTKVSGRLIKLFCQIGDVVDADQVLVEVAPSAKEDLD